MRYLAVKNFERFQHYKARGGIPAWIKMHKSLLTDYEFHSLPDKSKAHLMMIWLLVSQRNDRRIPNDAKWVGQQIGATDKVDLQILVEGGWLVDANIKAAEIQENLASNLLEHSEISASNALEQNRREEEEKRKEYRPTDSGVEATPTNGNGHKPEGLKPEDLVEAWNEHIAPLGLGRVMDLSPTRRRKALARIHEHPDEEFWKLVLGNIRGSPFLKGLSKPRADGQKPFRASFDWLIENDTNVLKIREGKYNGQAFA